MGVEMCVINDRQPRSFITAALQQNKIRVKSFIGVDKNCIRRPVLTVLKSHFVTVKHRGNSLSNSCRK